MNDPLYAILNDDISYVSSLDTKVLIDLVYAPQIIESKETFVMDFVVLKYDINMFKLITQKINEVNVDLYPLTNAGYKGRQDTELVLEILENYDNNNSKLKTMLFLLFKENLDLFKSVDDKMNEVLIFVLKTLMSDQDADDALLEDQTDMLGFLYKLISNFIKTEKEPEIKKFLITELNTFNLLKLYASVASFGADDDIMNAVRTGLRMMKISFNDPKIADAIINVNDISMFEKVLKSRVFPSSFPAWVIIFIARRDDFLYNIFEKLLADKRKRAFVVDKITETLRSLTLNNEGITYWLTYAIDDLFPFKYYRCKEMGSIISLMIRNVPDLLGLELREGYTAPEHNIITYLIDRIVKTKNKDIIYCLVEMLNQSMQSIFDIYKTIKNTKMPDFAQYVNKYIVDENPLFLVGLRKKFEDNQKELESVVGVPAPVAEVPPASIDETLDFIEGDLGTKKPASKKKKKKKKQSAESLIPGQKTNIIPLNDDEVAQGVEESKVTDALAAEESDVMGVLAAEESDVMGVPVAGKSDVIGVPAAGKSDAFATSTSLASSITFRDAPTLTREGMNKNVAEIIERIKNKLRISTEHSPKSVVLPNELLWIIFAGNVAVYETEDADLTADVLEFLGDRALKLVHCIDAVEIVKRKQLGGESITLAPKNLTRIVIELEKNETLMCYFDYEHLDVCDDVYELSKMGALTLPLGGGSFKKTWCSDFFEAVVGAIFHFYNKTSEALAMENVRRWLALIQVYDEHKDYIVNNKTYCVRYIDVV